MTGTDDRALGSETPRRASGPHVRRWALTYVAQAMSGVFMMGSSIVGARVLGDDGFGIFWTAASLVFIAYNLANLGLAQGATHHVAREPWRADLAHTSMAMGAGLGLVAVLVTAVVTFAVRGAFVDLDVAVTAVALACLPAHFVLNVGLGVLLAARRHDAYSAVNLVVFGGLFAGVVVMGVLDPTPTNAAVAFSASYTLGAVLAWVLVRRWWPPPRRRDRAVATRIVRFGLQAHAANVLTYLVYRVDILLVAAMLGPGAAGRYSAAAIVAETVWFFSQVGSTLLFAGVSGEGDARARRSLSDGATRLVLWASIGFAAVLAVAAEPLLTGMYTSRFASAASALRILLVGVVAVSLSKMLENYIAGIGRPARNIRGGAAALCANVALNLALIPRWGIEGAAVASLVAYLMLVGHRLVQYSMLDGGGRVRDVLVPRPADVVLLRHALVRRRGDAVHPG